MLSDRQILPLALAIVRGSHPENQGQRMGCPEWSNQSNPPSHSLLNKIFQTSIKDCKKSTEHKCCMCRSFKMKSASLKKRGWWRCYVLTLNTNLWMHATSNRDRVIQWQHLLKNILSKFLECINSFASALHLYLWVIKEGKNFHFLI